MAHDLGQAGLGCSVVGFARQRELQVGFQVIMARVNTGVIGQAHQLFGEAAEKCIHVAAVVHIAGTRIEKSVA